MGKQALYTIGYEGAAPDDFWATLLASGVRTLIDIRDVPMSRKPGFSKKALGQAADAHGLRYVHLGGLGDPKEGRDAAKAGKHSLFAKIFAAHMMTHEALSGLTEAIELSLVAPSCLLCFERNHENCHRSIVASHMNVRETFNVTHLGVAVGLALKLSRIGGHHGSRELIPGGV